MFISPEEAKKRIESEDNLMNIIKKVPLISSVPSALSEEDESEDLEVEPVAVEMVPFSHRPGRKSLDPNRFNQTIPDEIREVIGTLAHFDHQEIIAKDFGISQPKVSQIKNGEGKADKEAKNQVEVNLGKVRDAAIQAMLDSIGLIDADKLAAHSQKDIAAVASQMSKVFQNIQPKEKENTGPSVAIQIYAPRTKNEDDYDVVTISR